MSEWPPQYKIKRHRRAKYVRLRTSEKDGLVITIPYRYGLRHIPEVLEEHKSWIEQQLIKLDLNREQNNILPTRIELNACNEVWTVNYLAAETKLELIERYHLKELVVLGNTNNKQALYEKLVAWLKKRAKVFLTNLLNTMSTLMQLKFTKLSIKDQKTLWGSCTADKAINLSYKLLFLPAKLTTHILIHELSHTVHLNHSIRFWNLVAKYDPEWREHRWQLRKASQLFVPRWTTF